MTDREHRIGLYYCDMATYTSESRKTKHHAPLSLLTRSSEPAKSRHRYPCLRYCLLQSPLDPILVLLAQTVDGLPMRVTPRSLKFHWINSFPVSAALVFTFIARVSRPGCFPSLVLASFGLCFSTTANVILARVIALVAFIAVIAFVTYITPFNPSVCLLGSSRMFLSFPFLLL